MKTYFLFMDESFSDQTKISAITGVLIPVSAYDTIRKDFYKILRPYLQPKDGPTRIAAFELHGSALLPGRPDAEKFEIYNQVTALINKHKIKIYRVGYYITKQLEKDFKGDERLINLIWFGLMSTMQEKLEKHFIIPVMDGLDYNIAKSFMATVKGAEVLDQLQLPYSPKIKMNLTGEVFFTDSEHSIFIQIADLMSYLFLINDSVREGFKISTFKDKVHDYIHTLSKRRVYERIIALNMNGKLEVPPYKEQKKSKGNRRATAV